MATKCHMTGFLSVLQDYIFSDLRNRTDLAFSWLYQEYANCMSFSSTSMSGEKQKMFSYDECLTRLLACLLDKTDQKEGYESEFLCCVQSCTYTFWGTSCELFSFAEKLKRT